MSGLSAIVGLGFSDLSRQPIGSIRELAVAATRAAVKDAGFALGQIATKSVLRINESGEWTELAEIKIGSEPPKTLLELTVRRAG